MQTQRDKSKDLSEVGLLKLENARLMTRIAELEQIVKEKNALETELKQIIEENTEKAKLRDVELNARIIELEYASAISSLKDNQIQNIINNFFKTTDMSCQKVIGVTNCHAHMSDLSSSNDSSAELALSKLPEIE
ncbi:16554_t:CDS:2, partial [Racocetra persica]